MLQDNDLMPFGKYKNWKLINVPAYHLLWLAKEIEEKAPNKRNISEALILEYVDENKEVLIKQKKEEKYHGEENRHFDTED